MSDGEIPVTTVTLEYLFSKLKRIEKKRETLIGVLNRVDSSDEAEAYTILKQEIDTIDKFLSKAKQTQFDIPSIYCDL